MINSISQEFIKYETHAIQAGYTHLTQKVENVDEGGSGDKCFWDFSKLKCGEISSSTIANASDSPEQYLMDKANLVISVADDQSFYYVNEDKLEYHGYITENAIISFDAPIIRMKYPFKYKDKIEGTFTGAGLHYRITNTTITGNYSIEADAKGTMVLPNGLNINNAFRVKSVEYFNETGCKTIEWTITKYLWYTKDYRYPIFSLINTEINDGDSIKITLTGYYNDHAFREKSTEIDRIVSEMKLSVFPNPTVETLNIKYFIPKLQEVTIELFSISGTKVKDIVMNKKQEGNYQYELNISEHGLSPGVYLINFKFGEKMVSKKIIIED